MESFAAMVAGRRAATAPKPSGEGKEGGDAEYMRIQLEEIVIVKDDAYDALAAATAAAAAHSRPNPNANAIPQFSTTGTAPASMENCARAVAAARGGMSTAGPAAAQGPWTAAARGPVGFD